jgi:hypothetical protein
MASTITLQNTINWASGYIFSQPAALGAANEPAITIANTVKQAILGPPFVWRWNRATPGAQTLTAGTQDYAIALGTFGFLEKAWVTWASGASVQEIEQIVDVLSVETVQDQPTGRIAAQLDDNAGNITFRVSPVPDAAQTYSLQLAFMKKATLFAALSDTWAPIPDEMSYIYNFGFLGLLLAFKKDPRAQVYDARFTAHLLGAQSGLTEMQKNIFLGKWLSTTLEVQAASARTQMGVQGRAQ